MSPSRAPRSKLRWDDPTCPRNTRATACTWPRAPRSGRTNLDSRALVATIPIPGARPARRRRDQPSPVHRHRIGRHRDRRHDGARSSCERIRRALDGAAAEPLRRRSMRPVRHPRSRIRAGTRGRDRGRRHRVARRESAARLRAPHRRRSRLVQAGTTQQVVAQPALLADRHGRGVPPRGRCSARPRRRWRRGPALQRPIPSCSACHPSRRPGRASTTPSPTAPLTGVNIQSLPQIAALTGAGLTFLVPSNLSVESRSSRSPAPRVPRT